MAFDEAAFRAGWRALAARHGFDPVEGATSYQLALIRAGQRPAQRPLDWSRYETTLHGGGDEARDSVEAAAWANLNAEANRRKHGDVVPLDLLSLRDVYRETVTAWVADEVGARLAALRARTAPLEPGLELA